MIIGAGIAGVGLGVRLLEAGIDDFVILRAQRVGRRHLVRAHVSRAARATSPRTCTRTRSRATRTGRRLFPAPGRDPRLRARDGRPPRRHAAHPASARDGALALGRARRAVADTATSQGALTCEVLRQRDRRHRRADEPDDPRARERSRARAFTRPAGTTITTLRGERVAVIGTGPAAAQFVPLIQPKVDQLYGVPAHAAVGRCRTSIGRVSARSALLYRRRPRGSRMLQRNLWFAIYEAMRRRVPRADRADRADRARSAARTCADRCATPSCGRS